MIDIAIDAIINNTAADLSDYMPDWNFLTQNKDIRKVHEESSVRICGKKRNSQQHLT